MIGFISVFAVLIGAGAIMTPATAEAAPSTPSTPSTPTPQQLVCDGQWHTVPSVDPKPDYGDFDSLVSVTAVSADDAWAIGSVDDFDQPPYGYQTLAEHWNGASWSAVPMPNPAGSPWNQLTAVSAIAPNDVWAVGIEGTGPYRSLVEHWDGRSWNIQNEGMPDTYLTSVSARGPNDVWVAGSTNYPGTGLVMHWDGNQWTRTLIPGAVVFRGIEELNPRDIWAVGQESVNFFGDLSAAYHFDGHQWRRYDTPNPLGKHDEDQNWLTSVHAVSARDVWATGVARDGDWSIRDRPFTAHWDGNRWSYVATPDPGGSTNNTDLWGTIAFASNDVWAVGRVGDSPNWQTFTTHWDGSSWTQSPSTTSGEFLATSADGSGGVWAVGDQQLPESDGTYRSSTLIEHLCRPASSTAQANASTQASAAQAPTARPAPATQAPVRRLCVRPQKTGYAGCFAMVRSTQPGGQGLSPQSAPAGYGPADLQDAYHLPSATNGSGQTVAIVDAFDNPTAAADLATYRAQYGLPKCTVDDGCLRKVDQRGGTNYPPADAGWAAEISLDLDMVSAACPNCRILLVEADDNSMQNLGTAVNEAVALGAKFVSNSYGGSEDPAETTFDASYFHHPGVAITASSGDSGYGVEYPAASQYVTSVGGTSLVRDGSSPGWAETAWSGAGSGCSAYVAKPSWQTDAGCPQRSVADVAAVADPQTGVAVYNTYGGPGWQVFGGTSASSPIIAATFALAGAPAATSQPNSFPYATPSAFNDVASGDNGTCTPTYLCTAGPGYDGPTGLGTPNGIAGFRPNGPHGDIVGTVTDQVSHGPLVNAKVSAGGLVTYTDKAGHYDLFAPIGSYTVTAAQYGYQPQSIRRVTVTQDQATTRDLALTALPTHTVSGTVTDGSGHGWPLYAQITIDGTPGGPIWTDPATGHYAVNLPAGSTYTMHVSASYPGYQTRTVQADVAASDVVANISVPVDQNTCSAPGYQFHYTGTTQKFDTQQAPPGWSTTSAGTGSGWTFDNLSAGTNTTGGTGNFAVVDSDHDGFGSTEDATLTTPTVNLTTDPTPIVQFAQDFADGVNDTTTVDVSTNGGQTWTAVTTQTTSQLGPTTTAIPIPQAAGKAHVRIRFHFQTRSWSWWWKIDDVFIGNRSCDPAITGGLVVGVVTDTTHTPLTGATVTSTTNPNETTTTASPADPAIPGGFYWLFVTETGKQTLTAAAAGYQSQTRNAQVSADGTVRVDFTLPNLQPATPR